ncbi:beta/alpha barrel domain-containing protein [Pleomorphovibrio marinus]|uniref:hydroxymethylglutaryl-CoA lyase n=1 Tax=Pleomorphovibrio marinus TaxID=2164132 RepID=UPI000E0C8176|nr:hydroxymethylglutaryl-CoA lyase [Pleomorphovibrio marinus]
MRTAKIIECPRDALQGLGRFVSTHQKIAWINQLLKVGFDTLDFGSFVSPKAIPQMKDTVEVLEGLELEDSSSKLLAIVANTRGALEAGKFPQIHYLGFPLSLSETFQLRNTNKSIEKAKSEMYEIHEICMKKEKDLVVYLSMGFGNPYEDAYHPDMVQGFVADLVSNGISIISFADTVGIAGPKDIKDVITPNISQFSNVEFGVHLHSRPENCMEKLLAAYEAGCRRFDGVVNGAGGCPMAIDELVGNTPTELIIRLLENHNHPLKIDKGALAKSKELAIPIFEIDNNCH